MGCSQSRRRPPTEAQTLSHDYSDSQAQNQGQKLQSNENKWHYLVKDYVPEGSLDAVALSQRISFADNANIEAFKKLYSAGAKEAQQPDDVTILRSAWFVENECSSDNDHITAAISVFKSFQKWHDKTAMRAAATVWPQEKKEVLERSYFQYFSGGHSRRGCPIKIQAMGRWRVGEMNAAGVSNEDFLNFHISAMEAHRYLLTIDQSTVGSKYVQHPSGKVLPVPLYPELGVCCICDVRGSTFTSFYEAWGVLQEMIAIDNPNYYASLDKMLIVNSDYAFSHIVWPMLEPAN